MKGIAAKLTFFIIIGGVSLYFIITIGEQHSSPSALISPLAKPIVVSPTAEQTIDNGLQNAVEGALEGTKGTYGVVVKNFKTGEHYYLNEHTVFEPGSLYKVWIMATVFDQEKDGILEEDEILSEDISVLNDKFKIASEAAEMTESVITLSVQNALSQMITISHNYAALLLASKVRHSNVKAFLEKNNFNESSLGQPPKTTPYDIALFFEKLYKGELADQEFSKKMMDFLKKQTLNHKLPKYLPEDVVVAHKTGEIDFFTHDAGIVFSDKGDYVIVIMSESTSPKGAEERIANVSKVVYEYFSNK